MDPPNPDQRSPSDNPESRMTLIQRIQSNQRRQTSKPNPIFSLSEDNVGLILSPEQVQRLKSEAQQQIQKLIFNFYKQTNYSFLWMFIIKNPNESILKRLQKLKQTLSGGPIEQYDEKTHLIPFVASVDQANIYFNAQNCIFNVIVDLENAQDLLKIPELQTKVFSIYLYDKDKNKDSISKSSSIIHQSKKIRGSYFDLQTLFDRAEMDLQNGSQYQRTNGEVIIGRSKRSNLPAFLKLTQDYSSEVNGYRFNAYAVIKLKDDIENKQERNQRLYDYVNLVKKIYYGDQKQLEQLDQYMKIQHILCKKQNLQNKHKEILQFYSRQSFYYHVTNNILRVCRSVEEFRPATIPFNENYNAIKYFHEKNYQLNANQELQIPSQIFYRGSKLKKLQFQKLNKGDYIELLGFISTSKSERVAKSFLENDDNSYLFIFTIPINLKIPSDLKIFDHGFVDFSKAGIQAKIQKQYEVLFNALNIYKITKIVKPDQAPDDIGRVYLEYGAIFELLQRDRQNQSLTGQEDLVLKNYRYCMKEFRSIKDLGDVLMREEKLEQCQKYYEEKVKKEPSTQNFNKLALTELKRGNINASSLSAKKSLEMYEQNLNQTQNLTQTERDQIIQIQTANKSIFVENQDSLNGLKALEYALGLIDEKKEWLIKAQKLTQRGQIYLKAGDTLKSQQDFKKAEKLVLNKKKKFESSISKIELKYQIKDMFNCNGSQQLSEEMKNDEINAVNKQFPQMSKDKDKVIELLLKINQCELKRAEMVGDKSACQKCAKKGKKYFEQMAKVQPKSSIQKAKRKILEAKMESSFNKQQNMEKSIGLVEDAIKALKQVEEMNEKVGEYTNLMAVMRVQKLDNSMLVSEAKEGGQRKQFNKQEQETKIKQAINDFHQALKVVVHNKTENHPSVLEIKNSIGEVEFKRYSFLQAVKYAHQVMKSERGESHTEGAKSALLICKTRLAQGQTKQAFIFIDRALEILRKALIKQKEGDQHEDYQKILLISPVYIEIMLFKCKVYNKQTKYDIALKQIDLLLTNTKKKVKGEEGAGCLAGIYEQMANIYVYKGDMQKFVQYGQLSLKSRRQQMGKINMPNAIYLCIMAQYMFKRNLDEHGQDYLAQACEIFSRFCQNHPSSWLQWSIIGDHLIKIKQLEKAQDYIRHSKKIIEISHSPNHINYIKMHVKYADILCQNQKFDQALPIYQSLKDQIKNRKQPDLNLTQQPMKRGLSQQQKSGNQGKIQTLKKVKTEKEIMEIKIQQSMKVTNQKILQRNSRIQRPMESPKKRNSEVQMITTARKDHESSGTKMMNESMQRIDGENPEENEREENKTGIIGFFGTFYDKYIAKK